MVLPQLLHNSADISIRSHITAFQYDKCIPAIRKIIEIKCRIALPHGTVQKDIAAPLQRTKRCIKANTRTCLHTIHDNHGQRRRLLLVRLPQRCRNLRKQRGNDTLLLRHPCKDVPIILLLRNKDTSMPIFFEQPPPLHTTAHDDICLCPLLPLMAAVETEWARKDDCIAALHELQPHGTVRDRLIAAYLRSPIVVF